jgi:hypothetical protein
MGKIHTIQSFSSFFIANNWKFFSQTFFFQIKQIFTLPQQKKKIKKLQWVLSKKKKKKRGRGVDFVPKKNLIPSFR